MYLMQDMTIRTALAVKEFTIKQIHAANPSKGWSMRSIQDQAAKEFPLWSEQYVYYIVKSATFRHCNL